MAIYKAPVRDMQFVLHELLEAETEFRALGFDEASSDVIDAILEEGAKFCESVIFPTNRVGDAEGCRFENGKVTTPGGFREAYKALCEGGWMSLACDTDYGGQGLPNTLSVFFEEMLQSANMAFSLYPGLTRGAYVAMKAHASEELKQRYLPKMVEGTWSGAMALTESHCGTDLGMLRTRAEPQEDGSFHLNGTKIFITGGEHDLAENIIHLVLARLPEAPQGTKGISMFLVPKFLLNEDGSLGRRNGLSCGSIEHKMGIKGASTCVMNYENAKGWLVGEPHRGLHAMFSMMNHERIMVGQQGLSQAEVAYQSAADYARERVQGRAPTGAKFPDQPADPIIVHPDVRRMLLNSRALSEGARALLGWVALLTDREERHPDAEEREAAEDLVALLTPVVKAYFTDMGTEACNNCLQVFGGHGYIEEWGMEQLVRDVRISQIYEGANGVHAMDLVGRKLPMHRGRLVRRYLDLLNAFVEEHGRDDKLEEFTAPLGEAVKRLAEATAWLAEAAPKNPDEAGAAAYDYLRLMALTAIGHMWANSARVAVNKVDGDNTGFYQAKLATARYYMKRVMPQTTALLASLTSGSDTLMALDAEAF
ncbi:MAG TPA: acyl-CoA dehydrogenase C-terminal domain-containing protein [Gammaproteobacteria bacterium]|nr:acyl-CoA dehydrogenase C-terminal domain-containing protein [Gammaproteobacteria bacterium]